MNLLEDFMERFVSKIVFGIMVGLLFSCASSEVYKPFSKLPNAEIIDNVQAVFETVCPNTVITETVKNLAYIKLLETAKNEYQGNIDVCDITVSKIETVNYARNIFKLAAIGKVVSFEGANRRNTDAIIEGALANAAEEVSENFTARSRIAIVYITAQDRSTTEYISGELEHILQRQGFVIIDRSELDKIRREQNLQMSGEVDDETAVSIGKFAGANIIVTGRVDGEGNLRRLRLRALDTQSAQVVGTASERL